MRLRQPFVIDLRIGRVIAPWPRKRPQPGDEARMGQRSYQLDPAALPASVVPWCWPEPTAGADLRLPVGSLRRGRGIGRSIGSPRDRHQRHSTTPIAQFGDGIAASEHAIVTCVPLASLASTRTPHPPLAGCRLAAPPVSTPRQVVSITNQ